MNVLVCDLFSGPRPERSAARTAFRREALKTTPRRVEKPWGYELIWAETELYVGKILHVNAGEALSVQAHRIKDETLHLLSGEIRLEAGDTPEQLEDVRLGAGESFRVTPGTVHRIVAVTDADVLEASTPHLEDVVRFSDRYGRVPGGPDPQ
jgi:mannose-6-phosphate isomerase-like protein (cupin superfamily)